MKSFEDKLETLDVAPGFLNLRALAQVRRNSNTIRLKQDVSSIFIQKRERLESGDFLVVPKDPYSREDYNSNFLNAPKTHKEDIWTVRLLPCIDNGDGPAEDNICEKTNYELKTVLEESVIDHQLTIDEPIKPLESFQTTQPSSVVKDEIIKEGQNFKIKVKLTDSKLILSTYGNDMYNLETITEHEDVVEGDIQEERPTNTLIFADEPLRLKTKAVKVSQYWKLFSLLIPNVFRHVKMIEEDKDSYFEFQDYSRKELLVQSNGTKLNPVKDKNKGLKKVKTAERAEKGGRVNK